MTGGVGDARGDFTLVCAAQRGDPEAFAELYRRHSAGVRRACARRLGGATEADDVVQAAFMRAFERIDLCRGDRRFAGWVHVIARNLCADAVRARARAAPSWHSLGAPDEPHLEGLLGPGPEELVLVAERARHLRLALARLPDRQRGAIIARAVENRGPTEIAGIMGLSTGAVDSLLLRARRRLVHAYEDVTRERVAVAPAKP